MSDAMFILIVFLSVTALAYRRLWLRAVEREKRWERIIDREVWSKVASMAAGATAHPGTGRPKGTAGVCTSDADNSEALEVGNDSPACGSREARRHQVHIAPHDGEGRPIAGDIFRISDGEWDRDGFAVRTQGGEPR